MISTDELNRSFLDEYTSADAIRKYSRGTAGHGVDYIIEHQYGLIYDDAIRACLRTSTAPLRILEFGCGAGMNLLGLLPRLARQGVAVGEAFGTDFSGSLIESARRAAAQSVPPALAGKVAFHVARNERLGSELAAALGKRETDLAGTFDFIFGVNTFRYCHRLGKADECARTIRELLRPGGVCVMIDMNDRFPLFRSRFRRGGDEPAEETYLPTLEEYAAPFARAGFEITQKDNFCWIPHSAGRALTAVCRALTPILDNTVRSRAMRSLVVAKKPV